MSDIGRLLGEGFNAEKNVQMLCPHCCSSDLFVRSAAVHVFECTEVENSDTLHCSRYHEMPSSHVSDACAVKFRQECMPLMFPGVVEKLQGLDWRMVCGGGVLGACVDPGAASAPVGDAIRHLPSEGDASAEGGASPAYPAAMHHVRLRQQALAQSTAESSEGFCAGTFLAMSNVFKVFAGARKNLRLCRLTPSTCSTSIHAACCWSELQDYFAIVMGPEFQNYEITALTLFRNDERGRAFMQEMRGMQQRRREAVLAWEQRGRVAAHADAALGDGACMQYGAVLLCCLPFILNIPV